MQSWIWRGILLYENEQFKVRQPDSQAPLIGGTLSESVFGHTNLTKSSVKTGEIKLL